MQWPAAISSFSRGTCPSLHFLQPPLMRVCGVWCVVCGVWCATSHESARCRVGACASAKCVARLRECEGAKEGAEKLHGEAVRWSLLRTACALCRGREAALRSQVPLSIHAHSFSKTKSTGTCAYTFSKNKSTGTYVHTNPLLRSVLLALWY
jgi:hypothetical protein